MSDQENKDVKSLPCIFCQEKFETPDLLEKHVEHEHSEAAQANAAAITKMAQERIANEVDKLTEIAKDARKGLLYTSNFDPETVKSWDWKAKATEFVRALLVNDHQKLQVLSEGTAALGGYIVPEEWYPRIVEARDSVAVIRPRATVLTLSTDQMHIATESHAPKASWRAESAVKSTTTAEFGEVTLTPYSLAAIIVVTEELLADAMVDLGSYLTRLFGRAFREAEEAAFASGSGTAQPTGIDTYTLGYQLDTGGSLSADDLITVYHRLDPSYRANAVWLGNSRTVAAVRTLKDTAGNYVLQDLVNAPFPTILGKPVLEQNDLASSEFYLIDLSYYYIGDRQQLVVEQSREAYVDSHSMFERDEVAIRAHERVDGELTSTRAGVKITTTGVA